MTISTERLLPCPFCGGDAIWHDIREEDEVSNFGGSVIVCTKCDACSAVEFDQKDTLIERWNRRSRVGDRVAVRMEGWQDISTATPAMHVLAARFEPNWGEWLYEVVISPPIYPFTHLASPSPSSRSGREVEMACGYEGYEFGAGYIDSCCIDGYLWDLDSCDEPGGGLTHGGDMPCPRCNTKAFLEAAIEDAEGCGSSMFVPWCGAEQWERAIAKAMAENAPATSAFLKTAKPFVACDWPDRKAVHSGNAPWDRTIDRTWPWALPGAVS